MMSQFGTPGKNPPWARNTGTSLGQQSQLTSPLIMQAALGGPGVTQAQAVAGNQVTLQQQQQQAVTPQSAFNAAGLTALSLAQVGLEQTRENLFLVQNAAALQQGAVLTQPGVALPTSLASTPVVGTASGLALQTTLSTTPVATVSYPAPRVLQHTAQFQQQQLSAPPLTPKQRVITGTITKLQETFGFVDDDVFFQTSCVKGAMPKVGDRVLVEASYNPQMPFKWNALRIQLLPNQAPCHGQLQVQNHPQNALIRPGMMPPNSVPPILSGANLGPQLAMAMGGQSGAIMPPNMSMAHMSQPMPNYSQVPPPTQQQISRLPSLMGPPGSRRHSPPPPIRRDRDVMRRHPSIDGGGIGGGGGGGGGGGVDRRERDRHRERDHERERNPVPCKRSRSPRPRSRSLPRRRARVAPRYVVQIPKISLDVKEANVMELRKRYSNMYVPSDFFTSSFVWMDAFPLSRPFTLERPGTFHIMHKEVDPINESDASVVEPQDVDHTFTAKVMLLSAPPLDELYHKSCALAEDSTEVKENFVHPTRLISFLVGLKSKNETMAIGGPWSPSLDGANPDKDPTVLIKTAIRTCRALTGIDLGHCSKWYRFAEVYYHRAESTHKGRVVPARVETVVLFLPDVWSCTPTRKEWLHMSGAYKKQLQRKLNEEAPEAAENQPVDDSPKDVPKKDPSHHSDLDPKSMKHNDLRHELEVRNLSSKGLKSQLIARLTKALKVEHEKEEEDAEGKPEDDDDDGDEEKMEVVEKEDCEKKKKEEEEKKKDEKERSVRERRYILPDTQAIVVHPSRVAKGGKFDCTVMSLSVLLDYRQEDNKEYSFEVSLFAELFNEMLMRDFGFRLYRALVEVPEKKEVEDKDKKKEKDKRDENKKEEKEDGDSKKDGASSKEVVKKKKEDEDYDQDMEDDDEDDEMEDDDEEERKDRKKDDKKHDKDKKSEKVKLYTTDPSLLLASVYFDQNHCGYLLEKDLEEIIYTLGLNLSRAQVRKLLQNAVAKDNFVYRKLTDKPKPKEDTDIDAAKTETEKVAPNAEELAAGNRTLLSAVKCLVDGGPREAPSSSSLPDVSGAGHVMYNGALLEIGKLLQQLQRSEKARTDVEEKLTTTQEELDMAKDTVNSLDQSNQKLSSELRDVNRKLRSTDDELQSTHEQVLKYQGIVQSCHDLMLPVLPVESAGVASEIIQSERQEGEYNEMEESANDGSDNADDEMMVRVKLERENGDE